MKAVWTTAYAGALLALAALARPAHAESEPGAQPPACERLRTLAGADAQVDQVQSVAAGTVLPGPVPGAPGLPAPAHCVLRATIAPRTGVDGRRYGIGFELRLPADWNGRFLFQGGGGLDGVIQPALGADGSGQPPALSRGFAVVSTDAGHEGLDASFATDQQARLDYAYVALGKVTERAKAIIAAFYGRPARYSYFNGCSNGGRQGLMAVERYPLLFDGVVAGDPGFHLSRAAVGEAWNTAQFARVAPRDSGGRPIFGQAFSDRELRLVADAVTATCDRLDGLADGSVNNWQACRFDIARLTCRPGQSTATAACLSAAKVDVLRRIFAGAHDSHGRPLYAGWAWDPGMAAPGWRAWMIGNAATAPGNGLNQLLGGDSLARYFATPPMATPLDQTRIDFDTIADRVAETGAINDSTGTFATSYVAHGGKLIVYHGLADPVFSPLDTVAWYQRLQATMGPTQGPIQGWSRLFLIPGMNHCAMGPATDHFDALSAVQAWVEQGRAPERLIATGVIAPAARLVERPLCPYPSYARYAGGPTDRAASFRCTVAEGRDPAGRP